MKSFTDPGIQRIREYFGPHEEVIAVYLFGSYARGCARPYSDIDLGVLFEHENHHAIAEKVADHRMALARILRKEMHVIALNAASPLLMRQILTKGRCISTNNPKKLALFQMATFGKIADFAIYKTTFERAFTRKLVQG